MKKRLALFSNDHSFFLFGARGTGKSTLIREQLMKAHQLVKIADDSLGQ